MKCSRCGGPRDTAPRWGYCRACRRAYDQARPERRARKRKRQIIADIEYPGGLSLLQAAVLMGRAQGHIPHGVYRSLVQRGLMVGRGALTDEGRLLRSKCIRARRRANISGRQITEDCNG